MNLFHDFHILHTPRLKIPFDNQTNKYIVGDVNIDK